MNSYTISVKILGMLRFVSDKIVRTSKKKMFPRQACGQKLCDIITDPSIRFP